MMLLKIKLEVGQRQMQLSLFRVGWERVNQSRTLPNADCSNHFPLMVPDIIIHLLQHRFDILRRLLDFNIDSALDLWKFIVDLVVSSFIFGQHKYPPQHLLQEGKKLVVCWANTHRFLYLIKLVTFANEVIEPNAHTVDVIILQWEGGCFFWVLTVTSWDCEREHVFAQVDLFIELVLDYILDFRGLLFEGLWKNIVDWSYSDTVGEAEICDYLRSLIVNQRFGKWR